MDHARGTGHHIVPFITAHSGQADAPDADDLVVEQGGATLVVDPVSLDLVAGSVVDYVESLGGAAFKVENPNAASGCGCGSSFAI